MSTVRAVENTFDFLVAAGLGKPYSRAFVAGVAAAALAYGMKFPAAGFDEEGNPLPFQPLSSSPEAVLSKHFLVLPVATAAAVFLFT